MPGHLQVPTTSAGVGQPVRPLPHWCTTAWLQVPGGQPLEEGPTTSAYHISQITSATAQDIKTIETFMELNMSCGMALRMETYTTTMFHVLSAPQAEVRS